MVEKSDEPAPSPFSRKAIAKTASTELVKWVVLSILGLVAVGSSWLWGWFAAGGPRNLVGAMPPGAVAAFTTECPTSAGWAPFKEATGRFIVGAGRDYAPSYGQWDMKTPDGSLQRFALSEDARDLMQAGGEVRHRLSIAEMPKHDHTPDGNFVNLMMADGNGTTMNLGDYTKGEPNLLHANRIQPQGDNEPHSVMPPFIALNWCKKIN